jgi:ribosomal protein S6--L-glutamate ligase
VQILRVAIIHDAPVPTSSVRHLLIAFIKRGADALYLRLSKLSAYIEEGNLRIGYGKTGDVELDAAVIRGIGFISSVEQIFRRINVLRQIEALGTLVINPIDSMLIARDKYATVVNLRKAGIPVPDTALVEDVFEAVEIVKRWGEVVIKPLMGSMGYGSVKASDPDLVYVISKVWLAHGQPIYIQKYIEKPSRDIRIMVVGDEVLGGIYRYTPEGLWKTNVAQGAKVEPAPLNEELKELALKSTKALNLIYAGVDIGESKDGYVIFEVNSAPHWAGFMSATGLNPAEKIADYVISKLKK